MKRNEPNTKRDLSAEDEILAAIRENRVPPTPAVPHDPEGEIIAKIKATRFAPPEASPPPSAAIADQHGNAAALDAFKAALAQDEPTPPAPPEAAPPPSFGNIATRPTSRRKMNWGGLLFLLVVLILVWIAVSHGTRVRKENDEKLRAEEAKQQQIAASIVAFAVKYNAVTNCEDSLQKQDSGAARFSIEISRALIRSDHRPLLVQCRLNDIVEKDGKIIASLSSEEMSTGNLRFELQCNLELSKSLTAAKMFSRFAVVAKPLEVKKISGDSEEWFSVKGELVDALQLP